MSYPPWVILRKKEPEEDLDGLQEKKRNVKSSSTYIRYEHCLRCVVGCCCCLHLKCQFPWKRSNLAFRHCGLSNRCLLFLLSLLQTAGCWRTFYVHKRVCQACMHAPLCAEVCPSIDLHLQRNRNTLTPRQSGQIKLRASHPGDQQLWLTNPCQDVIHFWGEKIVSLNFNSLNEEEGKWGCRAFWVDSQSTWPFSFSTVAQMPVQRKHTLLRPKCEQKSAFLEFFDLWLGFTRAEHTQ